MYLTVNEFASKLRITPMTVYKLIRNNEITAIKIGKCYRIEHHQLHKLIAKGRGKNERK